MKGRWIGIAAVCAVTAVCAVLPGPSAGAAPTAAVEISPSDDKFEAAMDRLKASGESGYAGSRRLDDGTYELFWKQPIQPGVTGALDAVKKEVKLTPVGVSQAERFRAGESLFAEARSGAIPKVQVVSALADHSGLLVEVEPEVFAKYDPSALAVTYSQLVGLPVEVREGEHLVLASGRQDDSTPYNGGGMIRNASTGNFCSLGFGAVNSSGYGRMLSAAHCDESGGNVAWKNGNLEALSTGGTAVSIKSLNDTMIIDPIGGSAGWVFGGKWNEPFGTARYDFQVARDLNSSAGISVCTSGANSGEHCGLIVSNIGSGGIAQFDCNGGDCFGWRARHPSGTLAVAQGDSGGPVYQMRSDGRVNGLGIVTLLSEELTCTGLRFYFGPAGNRLVCGRTVWYTDVQMVLRDWNLVIATDP